MIAPSLLEHYPDLNDAQRMVVGHLDGPLLVIAGPGSGKTYSIVLRALNLLLLNKAAPKEIVLCTFTEKAAFELRDRLAAAARKVGYGGDLSELTISTIHGLCNRILARHRHRTHLGHNYDTLDELTQLLFIFERFDAIIGSPADGRYLGRWTTRWTAIQGARDYFNKITEELVDPQRLMASGDAFLAGLGHAYLAYEQALAETNRIDFAHLQRVVLELLDDPEAAAAVTRSVKYVLVDEYQDTNYVQERLLLKLTESTRNLCVVGDEDQSLYRFRGATVRNILEFPQRMPDCAIVKLTTNYRSHRAIVERYDRWMASADWRDRHGRTFRFDKTIVANDAAAHPDYPAVFAIWGRDERDEASRFADLVAYLKAEGIIEDYSQVALLLHSVRQEHSRHYLAALAERGIPAFCPRARAYFENEAVRQMVACFALIFGWYGDGRGQVTGAVAELAEYVDNAIMELGRRFAAPHPLADALRQWSSEIAGLREGESLDMRPADYFYRLLALEPFKSAVNDEATARNLAIFSQLLNTFQTYYHYTVVTHGNREPLRLHLFNSFLRLLYDGGINEYEDPNQPFPKGHVQVMTIHQSKGLEFPVVVVGSLAKQIASPKQVDRDLAPFYQRPPFEPEDRITGFDRMRLHYVAFSRAQNVLVLTAAEPPKDYFAPIWQGLPQWPYVQKELLAAQRFRPRERMPVKKSYSFTGDLKIYETCPRQYLFFREYDFAPSRSAVIFFGLLVHQTIEGIHRIALDGKLDTLDEPRIRALFDRTFRTLCLSDVRPIGDAEREAAFQQVMNYFRQNRDAMRRIIQTEVDVSLEKDGYILTGKVDLLMGDDRQLELLDFKTSPRPKDSPALLAAYERQLCTYAHILERRHNKRVARLMLYWTSEPRKEDALMVLPYDPARVEEAGRYFDDTVRRIQAREFAVTTPPEAAICLECDLRALCRSERIITIPD
ncbi:MAG: ATP-dependent helicase [Thermoflexales bacterium]|nr:ATP-dependent helicase [Thermoflexales bacterium]MDW8352842.1 ATP-dependent DNA helicase [Anaerolineae bacterium]